MESDWKNVAIKIGEAAGTHESGIKTLKFASFYAHKMITGVIE